ncbi:dihydrolipoyllysine-residue acetyltransferase component 2 of pyruvate dehydrogenase complex, mitochondrial isoform X2 [Pistacia vera]|uniref:dihydrolipoyllysine-residue acetyltransferase component 2 of pyruvate dehydrogenase complex, mitochondrial isoform X2 n=1 Tax=Pistacia vera TaxID=55513 RepID=UPI0012635228|nr:dihydrolipoyllysine-residue acetyltransferase component 2 of pyruvate dehydrogenase complex, mitochondrial isoform X2 [Pistacia vera]
MAYASHIINHSKKLRNVTSILRHEHAVLARWFSDDAFSKRDDLLKLRRHGYAPVEKERVFNSTINSTVSSFGVLKKNLSSTTRIAGNTVVGSLSNKGFTCSQVHSRRGFASDTGLPPHQEIGMPSLSPTMTEGNIARWLKKEGDKISPGEVLCEVETDKATVEMECMEEGYLAKILKGDGAKEIQVGEVIAITVEDEDDIGKFKDYSPSPSDAGAAAPKEPSPPPPPKQETVEKPVSLPEPKISKPSEAPAGDRIFASPLARKLAEDNNVPLSSIKGTGPDGHIVKADIEDYLASRGKEVSAKAKDAAAAALDYVDIPHSQIRKVTASRLLLSKQTIPHYYLTVDTCVDKLMGLRSQLNSIQEASGGKRISVNDLVIKAAALALRKVPRCNSSWTDDYIRQYNNVNINVAVQTDNGLYVPVVRDADKKGLSTISEEVKQLAQKAKENSLKPEDYEGGTFTVTNLGGPFGIKQFCAIINPPQSGILAVGSAEKRVIPGAGPDEYKFASFMSVTLSCDHRVIDGAVGAEWLKAFKGYIENPESMLL